MKLPHPLHTGWIAQTAQTAILVGALSLPAPVLAESVRLTSPDGTVNLNGDLIDFSDGTYTVRTNLGDLRVSADRVRCEGAGCPGGDATTADIIIAGSDTVGLGVMPLLMSGYASYLRAEADIQSTSNEGEIIASFVGDDGFGEDLASYLVNSTTSGQGFKTLLEKGAHISMASRRIKPKEARQLKADGAGNMISPSQENIVAVDSLVIVSHPSNPVKEISIEQLRQVYAGQITNWSELGGDDVEITVVTRQDGSGTRSVFESRLFTDAEPQVVPTAVVAPDNNAMSSIVNDTPGAVGFVGFAFQNGAKALNLVNECGISTTPDAFSAKTEEYAFQRRLYLYSRADNQASAAADFIDFATSSEADGVVAKAGFIDLGISLREQSLEGARARALLNSDVDDYEGNIMRGMLDTMADYDRLSTTFRFKTGSTQLDERGAIDMARLVEYLAAQPEGTKVMMVGFTDDIGVFESNRNLSISRAGEVQQALNDFVEGGLDHIEFDYTGYGEIAPSACNTTEAGRAINRRVEVWISKA